MNICLSSIFYPVCFARYFERGLRRTKHNIVTAGFWTEAWIPWNGGMLLDLPAELWKPPDIRLPAQEKRYFYPITEIEKQLPFEPDLWLHINSTFSPAGKPKKGIVASVFVDSPTVNYDLERTWSDFSFNMQKAWAKNGDIWLPFAYDSEFHSPLPPAEDYEYDIAHIGVLGKARAVFGEMAKQRGMRILFQTGPAYGQIREIYQKSRLVFHWSTRGEVCGRIFEALAMGKPLLTDNIDPVANGLLDLGLISTAGKHFIAFRDLEDALLSAKMMLSDYEGTLERAKRGQEAVKGHSYDARMAQILSTVGGKGWI